jgi:hypothetical protein
MIGDSKKQENRRSFAVSCGSAEIQSQRAAPLVGTDDWQGALLKR